MNWLLPATIAVLFLASRRASAASDETPTERRRGTVGPAGPAGPPGPPGPPGPAGPAAAAPATETPPERRRSRRRSGGGGGGGTRPTGAALVRAAERGTVALAVDAQRSGTGQPSATTVANVQRSVGLPANGVLDAATRNRLADLLDEPSSQTALPPRDAAHRAARSLCAMALRNPARLMPAIPPDDSIRPGQLALGVPTTGRLDQTTMARALTELARDQ